MEKQLYSQDTRETGKSQKRQLGCTKKEKDTTFPDGVKELRLNTSFTIIALEHQG